MRLIDADALLVELENLQVRCNNHRVAQGIDDGLHYYMPKILGLQPTIDAVPVKHGQWEEFTAAETDISQLIRWSCSV